MANSTETTADKRQTGAARAAQSTPGPRALLNQLLKSLKQTAKRRLKNSLRKHWKRLLLRSAAALPLLLCAWLFLSVDISLNDRQTIASRALQLGGLGLTAYFVYSHTPPLQTLADKAALRHGIDPILFRALINQESSWNTNAVSRSGAAGLTQLMPATAAAECGLSPDERFNAEKNLDCGAFYLAKQIRRFDTVDLALAAYNAGPDRVAKLGRVPRISETRNYVNRIMNAWSGGI